MRREDEEQRVDELEEIKKLLEYIKGTENFYFFRFLRLLENMATSHYVNYFAIIIVSVLASAVTAFIMLRL